MIMGPVAFILDFVIIGKEAKEKLKNSRVAIFGLGGVGGYVGEALVRSGIGSFDLIVDDKICLTNLNRQIIATFDTVGQYKTDVMKERMLKINPKVNVQTHQCFFLPENANDFSFEDYDYIIDAVDTVSAKIELVLKAQEHNIPIISSMGAGNKVDPTQFKSGDGLVMEDVEATIQSVGRLGREGMKETNKEIIKMMIHES